MILLRQRQAQRWGSPQPEIYLLIAPHALALCREIDVLAALRIALDRPRPDETRRDQ